MMQRFSPQHLALYEAHYATHAPRERPHRWQSLVEHLAQGLGATSILDYGCGQAANLARFSALPIVSYDPSIPAYAQEPESADLVICMHMLEHVEPEYITAVLLHLWSLARLAVLITVSCQASTKRLPDGTPWHSFLKPPSWWADRLAVLAMPGMCEALPVERPAVEYGCLLTRSAPAATL